VEENKRNASYMQLKLMDVNQQNNLFPLSIRSATEFKRGVHINTYLSIGIILITTEADLPTTQIIITIQ